MRKMRSHLHKLSRIKLGDAFQPRNLDNGPLRGVAHDLEISKLTTAHPYEQKQWR